MNNWVLELREQFPTASQSCYLDIAYDCGGGEFSKKAALRYFDDWHNAAANNERGGPGRKTHFEVMDELRENLNKMVNGKGKDYICFTKNTNEGMNQILQGFDFKEGDNVVTCGLEHASVIMPCLNLQKTKGIEVRLATDVSEGCINLDELEGLCDSHTRIVAVSHVQSSTGAVCDLERLGNFCHAHGIFLVVDAIQSLGIIPFDVQKWHISAVMAASYKGLLGVNCVAFSYISEELLSHLWPSYIAAGPYMNVSRDGTYQLECKDALKARKMENSTVDALGTYVFHDSVALLYEIGLDNITSHIFDLYDKLYEGISNLGYTIVQKKDGLHANIVAFECEEEVYNYLRSKNVCLSYNNAKYIRLSIAPYTIDKDIDYVLSCLKEYQASHE